METEREHGSPNRLRQGCGAPPKLHAKAEGLRYTELAIVASMILITPVILTTVAQAFRPPLAQSPSFGVGRTPRAEELKAIDIDVMPDGKGLPPGSGTARLGKEVYASRCLTCHGPTGKEGPQDILAGGQGSLNTSMPLKTVGSYWPYATTLWDYVRRAMPFDHPGTLTSDQVYATTAHVLFLNGIIGEDDVLNQTTLPQVKMPNRNGFVADPRPDVGMKKKP